MHSLSQATNSNRRRTFQSQGAIKTNVWPECATTANVTYRVGLSNSRSSPTIRYSGFGLLSVCKMEFNHRRLSTVSGKDGSPHFDESIPTVACLTRYQSLTTLRVSLHQKNSHTYVESEMLHATILHRIDCTCAFVYQKHISC